MAKVDWTPDRYARALYGRNDDGEYSGGSTLALFEKAVREGKTTVPNPLANAKVAHLHLRHMKGQWVWVLSTLRNPVCKTPRCVPVEIIIKGVSQW